MWKAIASRAIFPSMAKHPKRPRDTNQLAKLMVDILTGQVEDRAPPVANEEAAARGRLGGQARKAAMTPEQRKSIRDSASLRPAAPRPQSSQ
jgi:hypothetical protein